MVYLMYVGILLVFKCKKNNNIIIMISEFAKEQIRFIFVRFKIYMESMIVFFPR